MNRTARPSGPLDSQGASCPIPPVCLSRLATVNALIGLALLTLTAGCGGGGGGDPAGGAGGSNTAPSFSSVSQTTFQVGSPGTFTISVAGSPTASISESGTLPTGVTFQDNGNGTATLSGQPGAGSQGVYPLVLTADNGTAPNASQDFSLTVSQAAAAVALPLKASANGRYLVDQNDSPFLLLGDSPQSLLVNLDTSDMDSYMSDRQSHGFNAILVMVLCDSYTAGLASGDTFDGTAPFTTGSSPADYDLSTPNPAYFSRLDSLISTAAIDNLVVLLDPIETGGWLGTLENNGATKAFNYGAFLGNRYKNSPNIIWESGNDFQDWATNPTDNHLVSEVMSGIASTDSNHLQSIELNFLSSFSNQDTSLSPAPTLDAAYTYYESYDEVLQAYNSAPTLPTFLTEANYEYENVSNGLSATAGVFVLREQEYWTLTSGATGQLYGNHYTWTFASGWQNFLDSPGTLELPYVTKLFGSINWWNLVPDQTHEVVTAGFGTYDATNLNLTTANYATTAWITDGSASITYDPAGNPLTVNMAKFNAPVSAAWYDPSNGTFQTVSGSPFANSGSKTLTPPSATNHDGNSDWVLALEVNPSF
jgi:Protein of unknown function (DUF4038)/Putative collagen-binding domain of a collagenase/Putative Ig domain